VASACGFRGPYSCGAAGEFDPFPLIRLQPIIDLFYLSNPSIRYLLHQKKETVPFVGSLEKTKNKARLIPTSRRLFGLSGKD
jgi:hypothetical protein